ncbi:MAG: RCC1 repeat-containing protein, partial [Betaproteobacteria bacterium]
MITGKSSAQTFAAGGYHTCAVSATGGLVCWGGNDDGQLGDNSTITRPKPVNVTSFPFGATSISGAHSVTGHTCAVTATGAVKCWGANGFGQLGDNFNTGQCATTTTRCLTPVGVTGLSSGIAKVSAGDQFTCALSTTGGISCWGRNNDGQLGTGSPAMGTQPTPVGVSGFPAMAGATNISGSYSHTCAVTAGGGVKCWGAAFSSQLGDNSDHAPDGYSATPVEVVVSAVPLTGITALAAGADHT